MLTVSELSAGYGGKTVLKGLTFSLDNGLTVLLGPNGSGKTTLLRAVSGSLKPRCGRILWDGEDLPALSDRARARRVALVSGAHRTLSGITGLDVAEMAYYARNGPFLRPSAARRQAVLRVAGELGARELLDLPLEELSAGQRQLVELVAAECQDTPVMLLDEPTAALDYNRTHEFLARAKGLAAGKVVFATLHDPALALSYADRILLLKDGALVGDFAPAGMAPEEAEARLKVLYPHLCVIAPEGRLTLINRPLTP